MNVPDATDKITQSERRALLLEEYKGVIAQIIHWDSHLWNKSKFFLTLESASVGAALLALREALENQHDIAGWLVLLVVLLAMFNFYVGYVWFLTSRRNREYLELRFQRARKLEGELGGVLKLFRHEQDQLPKGHSSRHWEIHLPSGFAVAWLVLLAFSAIVFCKLN